MQAANNEVVVWGTGEEARDLLYVEDFLSFVDAAIETQTSSYELVNVGQGSGVKIKDLVQKIIDASEKDLKIVHDLSKPSVPTSLYLDCTRAKSIFGWEPKNTLEEGIGKTIAWYRQNVL